MTSRIDGPSDDEIREARAARVDQDRRAACYSERLTVLSNYLDAEYIYNKAVTPKARAGGAAMTQKHTPTPWSVNPAQHERVFGRDDGAWAITEKQGVEIARTTRLVSYEESTANARFIVQAVNAHDELLAALNDLLVFFKSGNDVPVERAIIHADSVWVTKAHAAIAKATGSVEEEE